MNYTILAIQNICPGSEFSITEDDYSSIIWDVLEGTAPTKKQIEDEIKRIKVLEEADLKAKETNREAVLAKLGLTADEAKALLG